MAYEQEVIDAAQGLYVRGHTAKEIRDKLNLNNDRIVYYWVQKYDWKTLQEVLTPEQTAERRFNLLVSLENKTPAQFKEIEILTESICKLKKVRIHNRQATAQNSQSNQSDSDDNGRQRKKRKKKVKNDISSITQERIDFIRNDLFDEYQLDLYEQRNQRTRFILKSRQVGLTFYFSWEAFEDAVLNGNNQVFLSASKKQSFLFKNYIIAFARQYFDVDLKGGESIVLSNGAELHFISTNASTSQGYTGNLYVDEVFWIPDFKKLNTVAKPIASHAKWKRTYFSTASVKEHGAYAMWSGEEFKTNSKRKADKEAVFDISHETLKDGHLGADGIWRQIITIYDAVEKGCDRFNVEELETEYSQFEWNNLFLCQFMDQSTSLFNMLDLLACGVDSDILWHDYEPDDEHPLGNHPVWIGYDPARFGDQSTVAVVAPPVKAAGSFRIIEKFQVYGNYSNQVAQIKPLFEKYNVEYMGIDRTGQGQGVFEQVKTYFPKAEGIYYTYERKQALVIKGQSLIERRKVEWDREDKELPHAFMQIKQVTKNDKVFFEADRNSKTGHADYAMAILNAFANEPLAENKRQSSVTIQG